MKAMPLGKMLSRHKQSRIAEYVGVSRETVRLWTRGMTTPSSEHLPRLAEVLGVDLGELATIVAEDTKRRAAASDSGTVRPFRGEEEASAAPAARVA